ncbi:MAG: EpsI family protein [Planctomycetaceae bacterium]|jgi:hypothetical protein|nr:EpsI family protein [Planctomycetaceae bacterium]
MSQKKSSKATTFQIWLGFGIITFLTLAITVVAGNYQDRWSQNKDRAEAGKRIKELPGRIGDWVLGEDKDMSQNDEEALQVAGNYIVRRYRNVSTNDEVLLMLMVGPPGRLTVHTPEVCFGGRDYVAQEKHEMVTFNTSGTETSDALWRIKFVNQSTRGGAPIVFYYGLNIGTGWQAVDNPRTAFQWYRNIYKIQLQSYYRESARSTASAAGGGEEASDPCKAFLEDAFPEIEKYLTLKAK